MNKLFSIALLVVTTAPALAQETTLYTGGRCRWHKEFRERPTTSEFDPQNPKLTEHREIGKLTISVNVANLDNDPTYLEKEPTEIVFENVNQPTQVSSRDLDCGNGRTLQIVTKTTTLRSSLVYIKSVQSSEPNCYNNNVASVLERYEYNKGGTRVQYIFTRERSERGDRDNSKLYGYGCSYSSTGT